MTVTIGYSPQVPARGNDVSTAFPVTFKYLDPSHLAVYLQEAGQSVRKTLTTHYTVSPSAGQNGGTVTFLVPPTSAQSYVVVPDIPFTQLLDLVNNDDFPPEEIERAFDKLTLLLLQMREQLGRTFVRAPGAIPANIEFPPPLSNGVIRWRADMLALEAVQVEATGFSSQALVQPTGATIARPLGALFAEWLTVKSFGAKGDDVTDDTAAIQAACNYVASIGGGDVHLKPTGAAYRIVGQVILGNGVALTGTGAQNFQGSEATNAQWTSAGSWIRPEHVSLSAVKMQGHGCSVRGINYIHNQPTPPASGSWTPTQYGYCIEQVISHSRIEHVMIVNAWAGIDMTYTEASGGGTAVSWSHVIISAFRQRFRTQCVNDTVYMNDIHCRNLWYSSNTPVVNYIRANCIEWDCGYTDNIMIDGLEFFEGSAGIFFRNGTVQGNTHSLYNGQITNLQFNLCQKSMVAENAATDIRAYFGTVTAQQGNAFGFTWSDRMFDLPVTTGLFVFSQLTVVDTGGEIMRLGSGSGAARCSIATFEGTYSTVAAGQAGFNIAAGAKVRLGEYRLVRPSGAGLRFAGVGSELLSTSQSGGHRLFSQFFEVDVTYASAAYRDWSTDIFDRPGVRDVHQVRLIGSLNVLTAQAGTASARMSGLLGTTVTGIDVSTTGDKPFDSNWVDVSEAEFTGLVSMGRLEVSAPNGARLRNNSVDLLFR